MNAFLVDLKKMELSGFLMKTEEVVLINVILFINTRMTSTKFAENYVR